MRFSTYFFAKYIIVFGLSEGGNISEIVGCASFLPNMALLVEVNASVLSEDSISEISQLMSFKIGANGYSYSSA